MTSNEARLHTRHAALQHRRPAGPEAIDSPMVPGADPLDALHRLNADALSFKRVRLERGQIVVTDAADRELCAGSWQVIPIGPNGSARSITIEIAAVDPAGDAAICQRRREMYRRGGAKMHQVA